LGTVQGANRSRGLATARICNAAQCPNPTMPAPPGLVQSFPSSEQGKNRAGRYPARFGFRDNGRVPEDAAIVPSARRIAHLDMDAFFASVELLRYPQLKGLPLVIGGYAGAAHAALLARYGMCRHDIPLHAFARLRDYAGRGVITTATYAARQFGIGSAMGLMHAARLCPQAILLPVDFAEYQRYSRAFKAALAAIAPHIESIGTDEVYIDLSAIPEVWRDGGHALARRLQQAVFDATALSCSIGVAPNKLLAKMASDWHKPGGICIVHSQDVQTRVWPLACRKIPGVGPKTEARLHALGIRTIGELAAQSLPQLVRWFGCSYGAWLHNAAWGRDTQAVVTHSEPVSLSRETTFARDLHALHDRQELGRIFTALCQRLAEDLQRKGYMAASVGVKLRYADFKTVTRTHSLAQPTQQAQALRHAAGLCLQRMALHQHLRLLGVRAARLVRSADAQRAAVHKDPYTAMLF